MQRVIERFLRYIQIDSPTYDEYEFKEVLKKDLSDLGLEVYEDDAGEKVGSNSGNLIAKLKGNTDKTILFSSHMDTVSPGRGIKPIIKDGVIRSQSDTILASDDKAGIAAIVEMIVRLKEEGVKHHNLQFTFTISEEKGLMGSKHLDYSMIDPDFAIVLDSGGPVGTVIVQGPAQNKINVVFKGKTSHAGVAPEDGISAIKIAAEAISKMKLLRVDEETTANIGYIGGGGATNVVTDRVEIKAEARSLSDEKLKVQTDHLVQCVREAQAKYGLEAEIEVIEAYKAFKLNADSEVIQVVKKACDKLGFEFNPKTSGGGSDTSNYNLNGIPAVNLGVGMSAVHSVDEYIKIQDIIDASELIFEIAKVE